MYGNPRSCNVRMVRVSPLRLVKWKLNRLWSKQLIGQILPVYFLLTNHVPYESPPQEESIKRVPVKNRTNPNRAHIVRLSLTLCDLDCTEGVAVSCFLTEGSVFLFLDSQGLEKNIKINK